MAASFLPSPAGELTQVWKIKNDEDNPFRMLVYASLRQPLTLALQLMRVPYCSLRSLNQENQAVPTFSLRAVGDKLPQSLTGSVLRRAQSASQHSRPSRSARGSGGRSPSHFTAAPNGGFHQRAEVSKGTQKFLPRRRTLVAKFISPKKCTLLVL